ncbi:YhdP family protein [Bordetella muralis]|uniref:YhdP family protein n=1 Tax=Bordetella muralis TaxID=1649130 RepID=UPI0039F1099A
MSLIAKVFRCLFWTGFAIYIAAAAALLGLRYWILPNIDQWRPRIEAYASDALGARVQIGELRADWRGLNPSLRLTSLVVYGSDNEPVLTLPTVSAVLGWRSVLVLSPRLLSLRVDGPELWVRRDATDHLWIAGQSIDLNTDTDSEHDRSPLVRWLANQRDLALVGATVHWQDELRQAPDVALRNVSLRLYNGLLSHRFALSAEPPATLAGEVMVRGNVHRNPLQVGAPRWTGELYAEIKDAEPEAWTPWLSVPAVSGRGAARAWLTLDEGKITDLTADAALREVRWHATDDASATLSPSQSGGEASATSSTSASGAIERSTATSASGTKTQTAQVADGHAFPSGPTRALRLESGTFHLQGPPGSVVQWDGVPLASAAEEAGMTVRAELTGLQANLPETFDPALLQADTVRLDATVRHPSQQPLVVDVRQFDLANEDLDARLNGRWIGQGKTIAGTADFQGNLARGSMSAIHKYLPLTVNADAREWLARGLPAGHIRDASVTVKGDLDEFPFEDKEDHGQFRIAGAYSGAIVDYAPPHGRNKGWPRLENVSGNFAVDKVSLSLDTPGGAIAHIGDDHTLTIGAVRATIPDMEHASTLHLDGEISGAVPAYMALANHYQLGQLLDGILDTAEGTGNWRVPLKLEVPLLNAEDTKVDGRIVFADNDFRFVPQMPMLRELQGELMFSERGLRVDTLRTQFLGGQARISGKLEQRQDALLVEGTLPASGLAQWIRNPLMERLAGQTSYRGHVGYGPGGILDLDIDSDLAGMAIDLPAPLGKTKTAALPLKASWGASSAADSGKRDQLSVKVGSDIALLLEHDRASRGSYFARGALGVSRPAVLPAVPGMLVDIQMPELDLDAWQQVTDEAGVGKKADRDKDAAARSDALPILNQINVNTQRLQVAGWSLDSLTLAATRPQPTQWQVSLNSKQAAGSLSWQEASGAIAGRVIARLKHLALGGDSDVATSMPVKDRPTPDDDLSDIPAIDLQADQFSLYGRDVGKLEVLGTNLERGQLWRLDKLHIGNESATLDATGSWRLTGAQRGLTVDAKAQFKDLGAFVDRIGYKDYVGGGSGSIVGKLTWRDLPWTHDLANLDGKMQISLDKGRFLNVNSRSARLLELLSLQSLQRLAKLEANPADAWRDGFPFDTIRGDMALSRGIAHTEGYKLNGPVATIVLAGDTDIIAEQWNMKAVVIPNLDASGAAVVTALAVNPLIGLGAFVTQWLLKQPLARAMTMEYAVTGSWDDPKVAPIETKHVPNHSPNNDYVEH